MHGDTATPQHLGDDLAASLVPEQRRSRFSPAVILMSLILGGFGVVGVAAAFDAQADCGPYGVAGYGGYGCADLTDAEMVVEPATDLVDRQTVRLTGINFDPPNALLGASMCVNEGIELVKVDACDVSTAIVTTTDANGSFDLTMRVRRIITVRGEEVDCAVPDTCIIGAGTVINNLTDAIEGTKEFIQFDPEVPPVPDLEVTFTVDEVTGNQASGTVSCNRDANFDVYVRLTQDGQRPASASGSVYGDCGTDTADWTMPMMPGSRLLARGEATYTAYANAYETDGNDYAFASETDTITLKRRARPTPILGETPGEDVSVSLVGTKGKGADQRILVQVNCDQSFSNGSVYLDVTQWAGRDRISGFGQSDDAPCTTAGLHLFEIEVEAQSGIITGGNAYINAYVSVYDFSDGVYRSDNASAGDELRLRGRLRPADFDPEPNPDSRITIDTVRRASIEGTIECDADEMIQVSGGGTQLWGRRLVSFSAYEITTCDEGEAHFILHLDPKMRRGKANVSVSAYAYDQETYDYFWTDIQQVRSRVKK